MNKLLYKSKMFLKRNGSTILTCMGGVGVVATSVMAVKATPKALYLLDMAEEQKGEELTLVEKVQTAGSVYIPSVIICVSTITCIFGANALNKRRQAALLSAYALLDNSYKEYKRKVTQLYGEDADKTVRESIARDKYEKDDIKPDDNNKLFFDEFSGRYFESTLEKVLLAEYELNKELGWDGYAYLNRFYELLGIPKEDKYKTLGWSQDMIFNLDMTYFVEFEHTKVTMDDGLECYIISIRYDPIVDFEDY